MNAISRLSSPASRISPESVQPSPAQALRPASAEVSQKSPALENLFRADSFGGSGGKADAGSPQEMIQKLEELVQTVGKLAQLLGGQGPQNPGASESAGASGVGGVGGARSAGGASPMMNVPEPEAVPELGDAAPAGASAEPMKSEAVSGTAPGGASDAQAFLGKGPHAKDQVYEEIAHDAPGLGEKNKALWDAAHAAGASPEEAAILVAQQMQEGGNDASKSGGAENFGPLNLNRGLLKDFGGVKEEGLSKLNDNVGGKYTPEALRANVEGALTAMRTMGTERYLDHVRGGSSAYENPTARMPFAGPATANDDTRRFGRNIANAAHHVLSDFQKDPSSIGRDWRQAASIPYV